MILLIMIVISIVIYLVLSVCPTEAPHFPLLLSLIVALPLPLSPLIPASITSDFPVRFGFHRLNLAEG
jgi:hypothetical protein